MEHDIDDEQHDDDHSARVGRVEEQQQFYDQYVALTSLSRSLLLHS